MNRITEKRIKIGEREFMLRKFDPLFGVYLAAQTFSGIMGQKNKMEALVKSILAKSEEDFHKLQCSVLKYCYEVLAAGPVRVIDENENIAIADVDAPLALNLFIQTLMFSMTDFFTEEAMENLAGGLENVLPQVFSPRKS